VKSSRLAKNNARLIRPADLPEKLKVPRDFLGADNRSAPQPGRGLIIRLVAE
jgi:hypothetical protein